MDNNTEEVVAQPGEDNQARNLVFTITVTPEGDASLGVNTENCPIEIIHFYLDYMKQALMARHRLNVAQTLASQEQLVLPKTDLIIPR